AAPYPAILRVARGQGQGLPEAKPGSPAPDIFPTYRMAFINRSLERNAYLMLFSRSLFYESISCNQRAIFLYEDRHLERQFDQGAPRACQGVAGGAEARR